MLIKDFKGQVIFLTETKIDSSYPNTQFRIEGYNIYRKNTIEGGGGVIAYFSSSLPTKKLKLPKKFTTIEILAKESKFGRHEVVVLRIYRPPKAVGKDYYLKLENELNDVIMWASNTKQFVVITGDLNLDRSKPHEKEGKVLTDLEDIHGLTCLIKKPTRVTTTTSTLLEVILTNKPELFRIADVFNPGISDHAMVYGVTNMKAIYHKSKFVTFRSYKKMKQDKLLYYIETAPSHVGE